MDDSENIASQASSAVKNTPDRGHKRNHHLDHHHFAAVAKEIPVPEGLTLNSDAERAIWRALTASNPTAVWTDALLLVAYKAVKMETALRKMLEALDRDGYSITDQKGQIRAHPLVRQMDAMT